MNPSDIHNFYFPKKQRHELYLALAENGLSGKCASAFFRTAAELYVQGKLPITNEQILLQCVSTPTGKESKL